MSIEETLTKWELETVAAGKASRHGSGIQLHNPDLIVPPKVRTDELDRRMECDHVVLIGEGRTVADVEGIYAPEAIWDGWGDGVHIEPGSPWTPLNGYSGQDGYSGPVMHQSEFIGGRLADHILGTPEYWVWTVVEDMFDQDNPVGWMVCFRPATV